MGKSWFPCTTPYNHAHYYYVWSKALQSLLMRNVIFFWLILKANHRHAVTFAQSTIDLGRGAPQLLRAATAPNSRFLQEPWPRAPAPGSGLSSEPLRSRLSHHAEEEGSQCPPLTRAAPGHQHLRAPPYLPLPTPGSCCPAPSPLSVGLSSKHTGCAPVLSSWCKWREGHGLCGL